MSYLHKVLEDIRTVESRNSKRKIKTKDDTNREVIRVSEDPEKQEKLKRDGANGKTKLGERERGNPYIGEGV